MEVSLRLILDNLHREFPEYKDEISSSIIEETACIQKIALFPDDEENTLDHNCLWFGNADNFIDIEKSRFEGLAFLLHGSKETLNYIQASKKVHAILLDDNINLIRVFNYVGDFLRSIEEWQHEMSMAIIYAKGLQALVNTGRKLLRYPLMIWNPAFELQAYTYWIEFDREPVSEIIKCGKFPGKVVKKLIEMGYLNKSERFSHLTVTYPPNWVGVPFVLRTFSNRSDNVISMVQYFPDEDPIPGDLELLHILEQHLEQYIKVNPLETKPSKKIYEPLLTEMLQGKITDSQLIKERLEYIRLPYESQYLLLAIQIANFTTPLVTYVMRACKSLIPFSKCISFQERIFCLINLAERQNGRVFDNDKLLELSEILNTVSGKCGVSRQFPCLNEIYIARQEADEALDFLNYMHQKNNYAYFQDIQFYAVLKTFKNHNPIPLLNLISKELLDIYKEDISKKNDNIKLLDFYLNHNCNITDTAKEMCLHRNSVIYRLDRIENRLNVDLASPEVRFQLQFMLKILMLPPVQDEFSD